MYTACDHMYCVCWLTVLELQVPSYIWNFNLNNKCQHTTITLNPISLVSLERQVVNTIKYLYTCNNGIKKTKKIHLRLIFLPAGITAWLSFGNFVRTLCFLKMLILKKRFYLLRIFKTYNNLLVRIFKISSD